MTPEPTRLARNEALFREVNERIDEVDRRLSEAAPDDGPWEFVCECADENCVERIELHPDEYESVRGDASQFVIVPGHQVETIERVVSENDRFMVVEKDVGEAARIAVETDPRAPR